MALPLLLLLSHLLVLPFVVDSFRILQIVPGFTNSHVLFNYRLAESLTEMGHEVELWTQMEMNMLHTGNNRLPPGVYEHRVDIHFKDSLKVEGLKVFQDMMFSSGDVFDLWWTGQEFKSMRVEACEQMLDESEQRFRERHFDLAIAHFHDLCPLAIAARIRVVWITHGTSLYSFVASSLGVGSFPASVPHPLSSSGHFLSFSDRIFNSLWHLSLLDFVNLPQNLLHEENVMYREERDLWELSHEVPVLLINGERLLDFPRPLPHFISFSGEVGARKRTSSLMDASLQRLVDSADEGLIVFSLGTVSNTTSMPQSMIVSRPSILRNSQRAFVGAFARFSRFTILWRMEKAVEGVERLPHLHLLKWLPQKELMNHPKMRLLIAHGGYNSLLETAQSGVPAVLMPLFADQKINAKRASRFGLATVLDKLDLNEEKVWHAMHTALQPGFAAAARRVSAMLASRPGPPSSALSYALRLATKDLRFFGLYTARQLCFMSFYSLDMLSLPFALFSLLVFK